MSNRNQTGYENILHRSLSPRAKIITAISILLSFLSCSPSLYRVTIQYEPQKAIEPSSVNMQTPLTVAIFNDARSGADDLAVGKVVKPNGEQIPIVPKNLALPKAVATTIKEYLHKTGHVTTGEMPLWNLREETIVKNSGGLLIGGAINRFEIVCNDNLSIKKYHAEVQLTILFADMQKGKIVYSVSATGKSSLEHIRFSEEHLQQQINGALSYAIEDIFSSTSVRTKIKEMLTRSH